MLLHSRVQLLLSFAAVQSEAPGSNQEAGAGIEEGSCSGEKLATEITMKKTKGTKLLCFFSSLCFLW
jgi:hypothetical protein